MTSNSPLALPEFSGIREEMRIGVLATLLAVTGIQVACSPDNTSSSFATLSSNELAEDFQSVEFAASTLMNQLWLLTGPPAPGFILDRHCVETKCEPTGPKSVAITKRTQRCPTGKAEITGESRMTVESRELMGCATASGPPAFPGWPVTGVVKIRLGDPGDLSARGYTSTAMKTRKDSHHRGSFEVTLSGTAVSFVTFHFESRQSDGAIVRLATVPEVPIRLAMQGYADWEPRSLNGTLLLSHLAGPSPIQVTFDNVEYRKEACCHPVGGRMLFEDPEAVLQFTAVCGQASLFLPPAKVLPVGLTGCSY